MATIVDAQPDPILDRLRARFPGREAISGRQAAEVLGVSTQTLYRYIDDGVIAGTQPAGAGSRRMVRLTELARALGQFS